MEQTKQEKRLKKLLLVLAGFFGLALLANIILPLVLQAARDFLQNHLPFVVNSAAKMAALFLLSFNAFINIRRNVELTKILIWIHLVSVLVLASFVIFAQAAPTVRLLLIGGIVMDSALGVLILLFFVSAVKSRGGFAASAGGWFNKLLTDMGGFIRLGGSSFILTDIQTDTLAKLIDAIIPPPEQRKVRPEKLVRRFEEFISVADFAPKELILIALDVAAPILAFTSLKSNGTLRQTLRADVERMIESDDDRLALMSLDPLFVHSDNYEQKKIKKPTRHLSLPFLLSSFNQITTLYKACAQ